MEWDIAKVKVQSVLAGMAAPDFEATTLDGQPFKLSELRGKVVLVDFWATWCAPCVAELPNLMKLYEEFGGEHFAVVGISFDRDAATTRKFAGARGLRWPQIWAERADEGPIAGLYGVGGIPATFLIGADGKVLERDLRGEALKAAVGRAVRKLAGGGGTTEPSSFLAGLLRSVLPTAGTRLPPELPDESPEARRVLDTTLAHYRTLTSYRDNFRCVARLDQKKEPPEEAQIDGALAWAGDRLAIRSDLLHVYCDGRRVTRYWPDAGRYVRQDQVGDLPAALRGPEWSPFGESQAGTHPLAALLAAGADAAAAAENVPILVVTGVQAATRDGRPGRTLSGRFRFHGLPQGEALPFEAFVNDQRQLFEEFRLDYTEAHKAALRESFEGDPDAVERAEIVITLRDVETDAEIADDVFVLNAPGAREYDFSYGTRSAGVARPHELLGQTAPALAGTALDGTRFDLSAERGRPVVVVFWATWAPQAQTVLRDVQTLAATDGPGVRFVGVNRNGAAGEAAVRRTVERSGARYLQVSDQAGELAEAWNVAYLPLVYVVDADGRVQAVFPSWADDTRHKLADCVGRLARGGPDAAESEARRPQEEGGGLVLQCEGEPVGDERIRVEPLESISASRWNMSEQDIDGDGEQELIFPDWQGGITIFKPSTGAVRHVSLPGLEGVGVQSVRGIAIDGETCWLCTGMSYGFAGMSQRTLVCLYAPRGELLWKIEPALGHGVEAQAQVVGGDLDGDGNVEFVIGLTLYTRSQTGENRYTLEDMRGRLLWLDHSGRRIAERELDNQVDLLYVAPAQPGKPAVLLCFSGGQLERYSLEPEHPPKEAAATPH